MRRTDQPRIPSYGLHKASGQARVRIDGRDIYLGRFDSPESHAEYRRVIGEYFAHGGLPPRSGDQLTVTELVAAYWAHRKSGRVDEATLAKVDKPALRRLRVRYGHTRAVDFGPRGLRALQRALVVEEGLSRQYVNQKIVPVIKRVFRWAAAEDLLPIEVFQKLAIVPGLSRGEFGARDTKRVTAVPDEVIEATLPHLPPVVRDMVVVQRRTGMRPGEVCAMRWCDIDDSGEIWVYRPPNHKTAHRGMVRSVPIGPIAQDVLRRYRLRHPDSAIFSPAQSEQLRKQELRRARLTPLTPSQRGRDAMRARNAVARRRPPRDEYTPVSYRRAIQRCCERAGIEPWFPYQLRHTAATVARELQGLDAAWALMGHEKPDTTLIYAEQRLERGLSIAREVG